MLYFHKNTKLYNSNSRSESVIQASTRRKLSEILVTFSLAVIGVKSLAASETIEADTNRYKACVNLLIANNDILLQNAQNVHGAKNYKEIRKYESVYNANIFDGIAACRKRILLPETKEVSTVLVGEKLVFAEGKRELLTVEQRKMNSHIEIENERVRYMQNEAIGRMRFELANTIESYRQTLAQYKGGKISIKVLQAKKVSIMNFLEANTASLARMKSELFNKNMKDTVAEIHVLTKELLAMTKESS